MLAAYFDDAGTHSTSDAVSWGGFIGTSEQWSAFDAEWRAKLAAPLPGKPRLRKFGLADCDRRKGEFLDYSEAESNLLQNEMREIIVKHRLLGMAFSVDRRIWDRLVAGEARNHFGGDAEVVCFSACFNAAIERAVHYLPSENQLSLHFDKGRLSPKLVAVVQHVEKHYYGLPALINIGFDVVEHVSPLQAADIIATENYWHSLSVLNGDGAQRPHLKHFLSRVSTEGYILDEGQIRQTLKDNGFELVTLPASSADGQPF
jgi:hypothetical protein